LELRPDAFSLRALWVDLAKVYYYSEDIFGKEIRIRVVYHNVGELLLLANYFSSLLH